MVRNENSGERKKQASQGERAGAKGSGKESIPYPDPLTFSSVAHARRTAAPTEGLKQAIFSLYCHLMAVYLLFVRV